MNHNNDDDYRYKYSHVSNYIHDVISDTYHGKQMCLTDFCRLHCCTHLNQSDCRLKITAPRSRWVAVCACVCATSFVCARRAQAPGCLRRLIPPINHSIWFLFIFSSRAVISASHWALYALPRRFPPQPLPRPRGQRSAVIWRGLGFQHFSHITRLLNFMSKSPQTCLSSSWRRTGAQVRLLHTRADLCQRSRFVLSDCKHTLLSGIMYHHPPFGQRRGESAAVMWVWTLGRIMLKWKFSLW